MKKSAFTIIAFLIVFTSAFAQNNPKEAKHNVNIQLPEVTIVDIEGSETGTVNLSPNVSELEAGEAIDFSNVSDNSLWLNYTSVAKNNGNGNGNGGKKRKIVVKMQNSDLPEGMSIMLLVADAVSGSGNLGKSASNNKELVLSAAELEVVKNIGSSFTGNGAGKGHQLTYSINMDDSKYNSLVAKSYSTEILFTITE